MQKFTLKLGAQALDISLRKILMERGLLSKEVLQEFAGKLTGVQNIYNSREHSLVPSDNRTIAQFFYDRLYQLQVALTCVVLQTSFLLLNEESLSKYCNMISQKEIIHFIKFTFYYR